MFVRIYKIGRWFVLLGLIVAIVLMLQTPATPPPPSPESREDLTRQFETKMVSLQQSVESGSTAASESFTASEVNATLLSSLEQERRGQGASAIASNIVGSVSAQGTPSAAGAMQGAGTSLGESNLKDARVAFAGDEVTGYFVTEVYGKEMYVTISGKLGAKDGYVTFDPSGFKVGDLAVPVALVNPALQKKLADPENRDKLKLPEFVSDIHVENGQLVVVTK
jgi:hypothetical protein